MFRNDIDKNKTCDDNNDEEDDNDKVCIGTAYSRSRSIKFGSLNIIFVHSLLMQV